MAKKDKTVKKTRTVEEQELLKKELEEKGHDDAYYALPENYQHLYDELYLLIADQRDLQLYTLEQFFTKVADKVKQYINIDLLQKKNTKINKEEIKSILVTQFNGIGDAIILSAFMRELRRNFPQANIFFTCDDNACSIYDNCPYINNIVSVKPDNFEIITLLFTALDLGKNYFWTNYPIDLVLLPHSGENNKFSLFISYFSTALLRLGYGENNWAAHYNIKEAIEDGLEIKNLEYDHLILTHHLNYPKNYYHEIPRRFFVLDYLECDIKNKAIETWCLPENIEKVNEFIKPYEDTRKIAIGIGGSSGMKRYPPNKYAILIQRINQYEKGKVTFFIVAGKDEEKDAQTIINLVKENNVISTVDLFSIKESIALMKKMNLYIGNDTSTAHMAAATPNVPIILIHSEGEDLWDQYPHYTSSIRRFRPWTDNCVIIRPKTRLSQCRLSLIHSGCVQNMAHCITQIKVKDIFSVYQKIVNNNMNASGLYLNNDKEKNGIFTV